MSSGVLARPIRPPQGSTGSPRPSPRRRRRSHKQASLFPLRFLVSQFCPGKSRCFVIKGRERVNRGSGGVQEVFLFAS